MAAVPWEQTCPTFMVRQKMDSRSPAAFCSSVSGGFIGSSLNKSCAKHGAAASKTAASAPVPKRISLVVIVFLRLAGAQTLSVGFVDIVQISFVKNLVDLFIPAHREPCLKHFHLVVSQFDRRIFLQLHRGIVGA